MRPINKLFFNASFKFLMLALLFFLPVLAFCQDHIITMDGTKVYGQIKNDFIDNIKFRAENSKKWKVYYADEIKGYFNSSQNVNCESRLISHDESLFFPLPDTSLKAKIYNFTEGNMQVSGTAEQVIFVFTSIRNLDFGLRKEFKEVFIEKEDKILTRVLTDPKPEKEIINNSDYF